LRLARQRLALRGSVRPYSDGDRPASLAPLSRNRLPRDTGQYYRNVDCEYIYNLDVSSLNGVGTYTVWVRINGQNIQVPATFDLK
jgi:hypothetical protein